MQMQMTLTFFFEFGNSCEQATGLTGLKRILYDKMLDLLLGVMTR